MHELTVLCPRDPINTQVINLDDLREQLLAAFRLVIFSRSMFVRYLEPLPLLALLQHPDLSIRYLAIELLSISLGFGESPKTKWSNHYLGDPANAINAQWEQRTIDYGLLPIFESERIYEANTQIRKRDYFSDHRRVRELSPTDLGPFSVDICGVLVPRFSVPSPHASRIVLTDNTRTNLRNITLAIVDEKPLLLQSIPGAGKSFLIDEIAKLFGRFEGSSCAD